MELVAVIGPSLGSRLAHPGVSKPYATPDALPAGRQKTPFPTTGAAVLGRVCPAVANS
jgi:hypothetical protein